MNSQYNEKLTGLAKGLRRNMTREERHLWYDFLKTLPIMVHRQKVIGNYIVDFYVAEKQTVIELDGSQHYYPEGRERDCCRDKYLESLGIRILRYSNRDVNLQFESVCEDIWQKLKVDGTKPSP